MTSTATTPSNPTQQQVSSSAAAAPPSLPQQGTTSKPPSGPIGPAAAPAASRPVSYAHAATKKTTFTPQSAPQSPSVPNQPQNARNPSNPSPVNGSKVPPAVPSVLPSAINGGANGQHSRKTSLAGVNVGGNRPPQNGGPNMPHRPTPAGQGSIQFGSLGSGGGSPAIGVAQLAAPAGASNPVGSPAIAPATVASGGAPQSAPAHNIQFGSFPQEGGNPNQNRPMSINGPPHMPTGPQGQHIRRDSNHSAHGEHVPSGMGPSRAGMASGGRRGGHQQMPYQGHYQQHNQQGQYGPYGQNPPYRGAPTQPRGGPVGMQVNHQFQHPQPSPNMSYSNRANRSPAIPQASPMTTPQMAPAQMAVPAQMPYPYQPHMGGPMPQHQQFPPQYGNYPQDFVPGFYPHAQSATSPRPGYQMPSPGPAFAPVHYAPGASPMSRSGSVNTMDGIHRPPSTMGMPPNIPTQLQSPPTPGPGSPVPNRTLFQPPSKQKSTLVIRNPTTQEIISPTKTAESPRPSGAPVVVSSAGSRPPQHDRQPSRSSEDDQKKKDAARAAVQRRIEEEKERLRKEEQEKAQKEEEERKAKEEEERKAKEEEERKAKEEEERKAKEEAERKAKEEEERKAKEEAERKAKEEEERKAKEAEEKAKKEAEEKAAKEAEEKAKKEAEEKAAKEAEEAKAKAEVTEEPKAEEKEASEDTPASTKPGTPSDEMPPPATKIRTAKPPPLKLPLPNSTEPPMPSAALTSLRSARFIEDISGVNYPSGILSPNPALNPNASHGKFKYDKDFLLQFQSVFTEKPSVDWDSRIRDTVGEPDSARPQTARMGSSSGRRGIPSTPMGLFGSGNSQKFPLGGSGARTPSTSEGRFEASTRQLGLSNPLGIFKSTPMSRDNSARSNSSYVPSSPKTGARGSSSARGADRKRGGESMGRTQSRREENEPKPIVTIPLSEVKPLVISEKRWTPRSLAAAAAPAAAPAATEGDNLMSPEMVQRKVKAALNKMTPEKFDKISDQILEIASQSKYETDGRTLRQVIQLTFEKATDEAAWSSMYAKFCKRMLESIDPNIRDENIKDKHDNVVTGGALFRKYLLNRCQEEFERGWKVNLPPKPEGESEEAVMLSDEYYIAAAAKRRGLGLIQFIGELFKLEMLTERIMHECVKKLVDFEGMPEEEEAESLVKLLKTIGQSLDSLPKSKPAMDAYFARIKYIEEMKGLPSRIRFMLMDIIDLRNKGWQTKEADKGPKTIAEIHEEAARAQAEKEAQNKASRAARPQGRGNDRSSSYYGNQQPPDWQANFKAQVDASELKKLGSKHRSMGTPATFGPASFLGPRPGARKPTMGRGGEDSGPNSRSGTPAPKESANKFSILGDGNDHNEASSPPVAKAKMGEL